MTMIVREMIALDQEECFHPSNPLEFSDDSGWLGPPRAVPFAWELAPGTPRRTATSSSSRDKSEDSISTVGEEKGIQERAEECVIESGRHSIRILESAPEMFLVARNSEVVGEVMFNEGAVPFKWEMEPGIPRDPDKCRQILDCPLTPPPVLHSRSMVIHSSGNNRKGGKTGRISLSARMRNLLWVHPQRGREHDFLLRADGAKKKKSSRILLLKGASDSDPPESKSSALSKKKSNSSGSEDGQRSDEDELSPVSVLEYNNSLRMSGSGNRRLSSGSSSIRSFYHTPKDSFSWENQDSPASPTLSSNRSFKSAMSRESSVKRNSLYSLLTFKNKLMFAKRDGGGSEGASSNGCLMMLTSSSNRSSSFTNDEASDFNSSSSSSSSSDGSSGKESSSLASDSSPSNSLPEENPKVSDVQTEVSSDEETRSVYFSPVPKFGSDSFSFHPIESGEGKSEDLRKSDQGFEGFDHGNVIERVDSLETIDPGFAPSEIGDVENYQQMTILNRMTSCARWQKRPSGKARGSGRELARSLLGRVGVCCYVRREDD